MVYDAAGTKAFDFGPIRLWIDRMAHLAQAEMWLEVIAPDTAEAASHLADAGVVRCDDVEKLPPDLDGFWILNPAGIVHLVCAPESDEVGRGNADRSGVSRATHATGAQARQLHLGLFGLESCPRRRNAPTMPPVRRRETRLHRRNCGR